MSRGDAVYAKVHVDITDGEKVGQLDPLGIYTYVLGYWTTAVRYRCDTFHPARDMHFTCKRLASRLHLDSRTVTNHLHQMLDLGLLKQHEDGSITITGVRACHPKLAWKDYIPFSPYDPQTGPHMGHT